MAYNILLEIGTKKPCTTLVKTAAQSLTFLGGAFSFQLSQGVSSVNIIVYQSSFLLLRV